MKRNLLFLAAALLCGPVSLHARTYTLEQCKALALENNNKMKNGLLDVQIAAQTRKEAFTRFFPAVSAAGMAFTASHDMLRLSVPLDLPIPGLELPPLSMGMMKHGLMGGVTALQPVFAGRQVAAGNRLARIGEQAGNLKLRVSEREVNETVERYFWQIVACGASWRRWMRRTDSWRRSGTMWRRRFGRASPRATTCCGWSLNSRRTRATV